ncbi:MAG: Transmembrane component CbrV of energizing module of predicted cobalamin ECF transporter [Anaerolineae bacterium]|jgi:energy-coupling factor transporter transmembrane protein EcfT|nr:MAG: Transmembrane component CbrV of energizing module of predicted cobalamin ECF transporter [Anaerolineae bacterium]
MTTILLCVSLTRNPLYLVVVWLCVAIVHAAAGMGELAGGNAPFPFWLSLMVVPLGAIFNALTVHVGERVIFVLPGEIPLLSGIITWEAVVYGATNGLALSVILLAFWVFNHNVSIPSFLRMLPRAFHSVAIVGSIAITFVPLLQREVRQIQEAQIIRGNNLTGLRNKLALLLPLLVSSLEHAFQLAEVMTARGFLRSSASSHQMLWRGAFLVGFGFLLGGWLSRFWGLPVLATNFLFGGAMTTFGVLIYTASRQVRTTVYRSTAFRLRDALAMSGCAFLLIFLIFQSLILEAPFLAYTPYPVLTLPPFDPRVACLFLGTLSPLLVAAFL